MAAKRKSLPVAGPWYKDGLPFSCTQCGNCCTGPAGYVFLSDVEIGRLAEHLGLTAEAVRERYCRRIGARWSLNEHRNTAGQFDCTFLETKPAEMEADGSLRPARRMCTVYAARPLQCRTWPFWEGNLESEENWKSAGVRCPGMSRGKKHDQETIAQYRDAKDWDELPAKKK